MSDRFKIVAANCTTIPPDAATDAGVAGTGVLLSFIFTAFLAIVASAIIIFSEFRSPPSTGKQARQPSKILRKMLLSFSDQQIITGIGVQSVGLAKMHSMIPYHFFLVWMLSLLSNATHLSTLLALVNDFKRDWVLRWLRQTLMFVNLMLSCVFGVFVLMATLRDVPATLPVSCVWHHDGTDSGEGFNQSGGAPARSGLSIAGTCAVIAGNLIVFAAAVWYIHANGKQKWNRVVQCVGLVLMFAIAIGATVRVVLLSQAFGTPSVPLRDKGEQEWSYGQLLGLLLLLLPLVSAVELIRGEINVPAPVCEESYPLVDGENAMPPSHAFQPNSFWGSQQNVSQRR